MFLRALLAIREELERCGISGRFERTFANRALQNVLWNMDTVSPACAEEIVSLMKREGFARLGIDGHDAAYFHDGRLHERYECLRGSDAGAVRAVLKTWREVDALSHGKRKLERAVARDAKRIASLQKKAERLRRANRLLRSSRAFRLGNALLAFPRFLFRRWMKT